MFLKIREIPWGYLSDYFILSVIESLWPTNLVFGGKLLTDKFGIRCRAFDRQIWYSVESFVIRLILKSSPRFLKSNVWTSIPWISCLKMTIQVNEKIGEMREPWPDVSTYGQDSQIYYYLHYLLSDNIYITSLCLSWNSCWFRK